MALDSSTSSTATDSLVDGTTNRQLSRLSQEVLLSEAAAGRRLSRLSTESLLVDAQTNRHLSRLSFEILIPTEPRYRGWGIPIAK